MFARSGVGFFYFYLCSLLGDLYHSVKLVPGAWQHRFFKQALLSLSEHEADEHAEHGWAHVEAGSVGEGLLEVVQDT